MSLPAKPREKRNGPPILRPKAFRTKMQWEAPAHVIQAWRSFESNGDLQSRNILWEFFLPIVQIVAATLKRRNPGFYNCELDEMISDGVLALLQAIGQSNANARAGRFFFRQAWRRISQLIRRGQAARMGLGDRRMIRANVIAEIRSKLTIEHGRTPTPGELLESLGGKIVNPHFQIDPPKTSMFSQMLDREERTQLVALEDASAPSPDSRVIDREVMNLALNGLEGIDRKLFKMALAGHSHPEISAALNIPMGRVDARINGLLWETRKRADLATYLETETIEKPARAYRPRIRIRSLNDSDGSSSYGRIPPQLAVMGVWQRRELPELDRERRGDSDLRELLIKGYSGRSLVDATIGNTKAVKRRISAIQRALIEELKAAKTAEESAPRVLRETA